jgi:poly-gamma-glutamate synthesis protein (capsule biosynthesis protein)
MSWGLFKSKYFYLSLLGVIIFLGIFLFYYKFVGEENWLYPSPLQNHIKTNVSLPSSDDLPQRKPLTLIFGGDVMLSRTVNAKMLAYNDYEWPFIKIATTTAAADITIFNLESPFLKDADYYVPTGSFSFKADPQAVVGLVLAGTDLVSLANNHILNAGRQGLSDTLEILQDNDIAVVGAGLNEEAAGRGTLIEKQGWRVAFLAYAYPQDNSVATMERAGITSLDEERLVSDIAYWREQADLVIILMHAGTEYTAQAGVEQIAFAHAAIDAGADAVIGHHPHWPQNWELYNDKPIFYSLGNFVFDQMWSVGTSQGLLARLVFQPDLSGEAELLPLVIKDYGQVNLWPEEKDVASFWDVYGLKPPLDLSWSTPVGN